MRKDLNACLSEVCWRIFCFRALVRESAFVRSHVFDSTVRDQFTSRSLGLQDLRRWERKRFQLIMEERINWQRILSAVQQAPWRSARLQPFRRGAEPAPDLALGVLAARTVGGNGANGGGQG
eukprot:6178119-Pleurochrysis_carterae.AAC.1